MKRVANIAILALIVGLMASTNAFAGKLDCRDVPLIDLRGAMDFDADMDGKVTIAEVAIADPLNNLGTLVTAVTAADPLVLDALSNPNADLTVFAPTNDAFAALPPPLLDLVLSAPPVLTDILLYHVRAGSYDPRLVFYQVSFASLLGQDLFVKRFRGAPTINNSLIDCTGVQTDNGLVWLINSVLLNQY